MIAIPASLATATRSVRIEQLVTLSFPQDITYRFTDGSNSRDGFSHESPVESVDIPRVDASLTNRELLLVLLDPDGDWRDRLEYFGVGAVRIEVALSPDGAAADNALPVFVGRGSGFQVSADFHVTVTFTSGFGQITAQRTVVASDENQRGRARLDSSLTEIGIRPEHYWGERV